MSDLIHDRGRGPEIVGTRITVYDIWDYAKHGEHPDLIASFLRLSSVQVRAAIEYIESHKEEVLAEYQEMLDRDAEGNPPEIQALLDQSHAKLRQRLRERREQLAGAKGERDSGG